MSRLKGSGRTVPSTTATAMLHQLSRCNQFSQVYADGVAVGFGVQFRTGKCHAVESHPKLTPMGSVRSENQHEGLLDFVFGVANIHKGTWITTFLYEESLLFIPRGAERSKGSRSQSVQLKDIADETYVMVPDACGLSRATRALFRSQRRKLQEYSGEAMSYQVLEEWAALGIGAAILPKSKVTATKSPSFLIVGKTGDEARISFEASWSRSGIQSEHLQDFSNHLRKVVSKIVTSLSPSLKR